MADDQHRDENLANAWRKRLGNDEAGQSDVDPDPTREWDPGQTRTWDSQETREFTVTDADSLGESPADEPTAQTETVAAPTRTSYRDGVHNAEEEPATTAMPARQDEQEQPVAPSYAPASTEWGDDGWGSEEQTVKKKRRWPWVLAGTVVVLGAGFVGANYYLGERVPADTRIAGVDVSGMTRSEAQNALATNLEDAITSPREIRIESGTSQLDPATIDLAIDYDRTLDPLLGFTLNPQRILAEFSGGENLDAQVSVSEQKLGNAMQQAAEKINADPVNATLSIENGQPVVTPDQPGYGIEVEQASQTIVDSWLSTTGPIQLPERELEADITAEELEAYATDAIEPIVSHPASVNIKDELVELSGEQLGNILTVESERDAPKLAVDEAKLEKLIAPKAEGILAEGEDARIEIVDHETPKIHPSTDGEALDYAALSESILALGSDRTIDAVVETVPADFTTADAEEMGIKEVVSEITTPLTSDNVRTTNLVVGTSTITNTLVKPGEQFNLGEALGPVDAEHGYVSSGVVANGFNSTAMGGGLSQLSTNTFNIGYRAGMTDVAHQPHSKYFDRYPMGLEATLWGETIPMIWENNTPYGALVETWVEGGEVRTRLWSTKYWDVEVWQGEPFNHQQPTTKTNPAADCVPSPPGAQGFSVTVGRTVELDGEVHEDSEYTWTYQPVDAVRCG